MYFVEDFIINIADSEQLKYNKFSLLKDLLLLILSEEQIRSGNFNCFTDTYVYCNKTHYDNENDYLYVSIQEFINFKLKNFSYLIDMVNKKNLIEIDVKTNILLK